jgi:hypothetical protein
MEKKIITKCPFPLVKLTVKIKYAEVQKPTGVGYTILELIKDSKDRNEKLSSVLKRFGVPDELQFIFADEIAVMIERGILQLSRNNYYQREYFEEYTIGNFEFTANGERMFKEGAIPTGEEKGKQTEVYFNPLTSEFMFRLPKDWKTMRLDQSGCLPADLMDSVETDYSGLKDFIIENPKDAGLQSQERLLECDQTGIEYLITKVDDNCELKLDEDGAEIAFKIAGAQDFYERYYSTEWLEKEFDAKDKFKFKTIDTIKAKGFDGFKNLSKVHLPEDYQRHFDHSTKFRITKDGGKVSIMRGGVTTELQGGKVLLSAAKSIFPDWSFIAIDSKEMRYYTAARATLTERVLDKPLSLNLLIEQVFTAEQKAAVVKAIYDECMAAEYSTEYANMVRAVFELFGDNSFAIDYARVKINAGKSKAEQAELLLVFNGISASVEDWQATATECANAIYNGLVASMTKENIKTVVQTARTLDSLRKADKGELLQAILEKFGMLSDTVELFNIITAAGYSENEALAEANIVKAYTDRILRGKAGK